ncbi:MAG: hypothetical protein ABIK09_02920 [Pseudomonadota bacterium]
MRPLLFLLLLLTVMSPAHAAVFAPMTLDEIIERSDRVVLGEVIGSEAVLDESRGRISTRHRFAVREALKGPAATELVVVTLGGETADLGQIVTGAARLSSGEELVLCLREGSSGYVVTGMAQGVFRVQDGPEGRVLVRDLGAIHFVGQPADGAPDRISEDALRDRLKGGATR